MEEYNRQKLNELYYNRLEFPCYPYLGFRFMDGEVSPYKLNIKSDAYESLPSDGLVHVISRKSIPHNYRRWKHQRVYTLTSEEYNSLLVLKELSR